MSTNNISEELFEEISAAKIVNFPRNNALNFVVAAPGFTYASGGVIALYDLARLIHEHNIPCKIFDTSGTKLVNNIFDRYATPSDFNEHTVAIYPEIIVGNPLNTKYVVRWILCEVGVNCPHDIYKTWGKDDFVYHYGSFDSDKTVDRYNLLFPLTLSPQLQDRGEPRSGYCHVIRKAHKFHQNLEYIHPSDSLLLDDNLTRDQLIDILNTKEYLISYDPYCYITCMAALCGCISIVIPLADVDKIQWLKTSPFSLVLSQIGETDLNGTAYGLAELDRAKQTIGNVREQHEAFMQYGESTVTLFINDISHIVDTNLADKKTLLGNNKVLNVEDVFYNTAAKYNNFKQPLEQQSLLAAQTYYHADCLTLSQNIDLIPAWLRADYLKFLIGAPVQFRLNGEADNYLHHLQGWMNYLHASIFENLDDPFWQDAVNQFTYSSKFIPLYFNENNLRDIYIQRAGIIESSLERDENKIDYILPVRSANRKKIRLGIIAAHFNPSAETFAALPIYEYLSRDFEVILYSFQQTHHPLEQYCRSSANFFVTLSQNLVEQVTAIRNDDLDILFFATNITAVTNQICLLASHRLARIQITSGGSVVTTGMRHMDYFISGTFTDPAPNAQEQYREKLIKLPGAAHCFSYGDYAEESSIKVDRAQLGIAEDAIVFTSGANFYKVIPELIHTWAKILAGVPNSIVMLFPFGPNWSSNYPKQAFEQHLHQIFAEYGVSADRILALDPQPVPNREDLKEYFKLADVYLDSYPFAGTTSLIEPLQVNLPVIARQGNSFRSAMGSAMIRSLEIADLVADSEESYIQLAVNLGRNPGLRHQKRAEIQAKMQANPSFLDSRGYAAKIEKLFKELFDRYAVEKLNENLCLRDINLMVFPDWSQSEEAVGLELQQVIQTLATQPESHNTTLLIDTTNIDLEDAQMFISSIAMNLMMEADLDITEQLEISLIEDLSNIQWASLLPKIEARIVLECDNQVAVAKLPHQNFARRQLDYFTLN
jgi:predicted O-linked N-acetylglucosamine transferase (SPINDLY family)